MPGLPPIVMTALEFMATLFVFAVGTALVVIVVLFVYDKYQTANSVRRNYPVVGRFRTFFEHLGEFFRQYFFAMDREELPFNRAQRGWADRASKDVKNTSAFGSTKNLMVEGTVMFANCMFPQLEEEMNEPSPIVFGPHSRKPYETRSFFNISAMSYGSLSKPAVRALSRGAKLANIWLNTGEGGIAPWHLEGGCDVVFQIGTAKYGARDAAGNLSDSKLREIGANPQVRMIELKLSQGAKPGKGGILPAVKVTEEIAEIRGIPVGQASISPNRHPEIDSLSDLLDMINRIRDVSGLPTGFKAVIGAYGWLDEFCRLIHERGIESAPDFITVDSGDGGTGAAPLPLMDEMGLPIRESLPMVVDKLTEYGLRPRIRVIASGKRITPSEVAWALCVGADSVNSARGFMFALGCIQAMKCNRNTCPTGVTTHNKRLQRGLDPQDKSVRVANYAKNMMKEVAMISHSCGVPEPRRLKRFHARVVVNNGLSVPLNELHPVVETLPEYQ
ncbi:MAG: FMN-binding glutamate synthase family protein [Xanthomonadales bacterium]|nr:FMN-binding glutamate synthase family protein [Xanthomonadales bacterium]NNL95378.1 FMN-binding glutamate synthase family protein [Xanthomonadales bacterium]